MNEQRDTHCCQVLQLTHELDRCKYQKDQAVKQLKKQLEEKHSQAHEKWQKAHDEVCQDFADHEKKHKEEFFALYADFEETKKQNATLIDKV